MPTSSLSLPVDRTAGATVSPRPTQVSLAALSLVTLLASFGTSGANVALPTLARAFDASFGAVQWVVLAYLLGTTTLMVSVGRLGDLVGRRRLLAAGVALFAAASVVGALAPALGVLIAARAVQGIGAAVMLALGMAFVADLVPKAQTGRAMGLLGTMSAVGTALGPSLGGALLAWAGWRALFWIQVPLALGALALVWQALPDDRAERGAGAWRFDGLGTGLLALTLAAYALAMTTSRGHFGAVGVALFALAAAGGVVFVWVESRVAHPLVPLGMLRGAGLGSGLTLSALVSTVIMATLVVGPFYLSRTVGLDAARVGLVLAIGPVVSALVGWLAGRSVDRFGAPRVVIAGLAGMVVGCASLAGLPLGGVAGYVVSLVILTAGYASFQTANNTAVMSVRAAEQRGVVSGLLNLARNLGLITGSAVLGMVFAVATGQGDPATAAPEAVGIGMRVTFGVAAGLMGVALALAAWLRRRV